MEDITLQTKIADLLKIYPQLEKRLMEISPLFSKLKNPVLRKTVARVATIRQVAEVASLNPAELVNLLRKEVGLQPSEVATAADPKPRPEWALRERTSFTIDVRPIIKRGERPMDEILQRCSTLKEGEILLLETDFTPSPLIEILRGKAYELWSNEQECYIRKPPL